MEDAVNVLAQPRHRFRHLNAPGKMFAYLGCIWGVFGGAAPGYLARDQIHPKYTPIWGVFGRRAGAQIHPKYAPNTPCPALPCPAFASSGDHRASKSLRRKMSGAMARDRHGDGGPRPRGPRGRGATSLASAPGLLQLWELSES